jgi:hypothetical protein
MKRNPSFFSLALALGTTAVLSIPLASAEDITVKGEVVDTACYLHYSKKGEAHKACAEACLKAGQDMGIYDEENDTLYVLLESKPGTDPNTLVKNYVAKKVEVVGTLAQKSKVQGIVVKEVK